MPARIRLAIAFAVAVAVAVLGSLWGPWQLALAAAMGVFGLIYSIAFWVEVWRLDGDQTRQHAGPDEPGRRWSGVIAIVLALASLGTEFLLLSGKDHQGRNAAVAVAACVVAWCTVHTVFAGLYADYYYDPPRKDTTDDTAPDGVAGGIEFDGTDVPCYKDFAYHAFTLGMTYQVSDTTFKGTRMRQLGLQHALLSFVFGTVIIATLVNFVAGMN